MFFKEVRMNKRIQDGKVLTKKFHQKKKRSGFSDAPQKYLNHPDKMSVGKISIDHKYASKRKNHRNQPVLKEVQISDILTQESTEDDVNESSEKEKDDPDSDASKNGGDASKNEEYGGERTRISTATDGCSLGDRFVKEQGIFSGLWDWVFGHDEYDADSTTVGSETDNFTSDGEEDDIGNSEMGREPILMPTYHQHDLHRINDKFLHGEAEGSLHHVTEKFIYKTDGRGLQDFTDHRAGYNRLENSSNSAAASNDLNGNIIKMDLRRAEKIRSTFFHEYLHSRSINPLFNEFNPKVCIAFLWETNGYRQKGHYGTFPKKISMPAICEEETDILHSLWDWVVIPIKEDPILLRIV